MSTKNAGTSRTPKSAATKSETMREYRVVYMSLGGLGAVGRIVRAASKKDARLVVSRGGSRVLRVEALGS